MPIVPVLMVVAMTTAALWLVCLARFLTRLHERAPAVYVELGRPVMRWLWWTAPSNRSTPHPAVLTQIGATGASLNTLYSPREIGAMARLALFIVRGDTRTLEDASLRQLGTVLKVLLVSFFSDLVLIGVAIATLGTTSH